MIKIDHLYYVITHDKFDEMVNKYAHTSHCEHRKTSTDKDFYEGLYFFFDNGLYIEILKEDNEYAAGAFGLALSDLTGKNWCELLLENKKLKISQINDSDGAWFKYTEFKKESDNNINIWYMEYLTEARLKRRKSFANNTKLSLISVEVNLPFGEEVFKEKLKEFPVSDNFDAMISFDFNEMKKKGIIISYKDNNKRYEFFV